MRRLRFFLALVFVPLGCFVQKPTPAAPVAGAATKETTTRQVVLAKSGNGYQWKLTTAPVPAVGERQVLIRVRAVALNRGDLEILAPPSGVGNSGPDISGRIVASDAAGDVLAVGSKVTSVKPGARVTSTYLKNWTDGPPSREKLRDALGASVNGVLADLVVLDETSVAPFPASLSYEEAATLPTAGLTGWMAAVGRRPLHKGDVVLIQGTGGVSVFAMQFASASGGRIVMTSSSDEKLKKAASIAPHESINYKTTPLWGKRVYELTQGHGADVVVDVGGKSTLEQSLRSLATGGTLSIVGGLTGYDGMLPAGALINTSATVQGIFVGSRADLQKMEAFMASHQLHPVIDRTFPFEQFEAALKYMAAGDFIGKIVLRLGTPSTTR
jgi:NADPH:quinone reductase-like Zn-dependent oxidoreductase